MDYFKIKVDSEEHSKEIQEYLFSNKVPWCGGCYEVENTDKPYLFLSPNHVWRDPDITYGVDEERFNGTQLPEKWFYDGDLQDTPREVTKEALMEPLTGDTFQELMRAQLDGKTLQMDVLGVGWEDCAYTLDPVRVEDIDKPVKCYRVKPEPRYCNGIDLDECIKKPLRKGTEYFIANPLDNNYRNLMFWDGGDYDLKCLDKGIAYLNEESAIKHAKAMLNILD